MLPLTKVVGVHMSIDVYEFKRQSGRLRRPYFTGGRDIRPKCKTLLI